MTKIVLKSIAPVCALSFLVIISQTPAGYAQEQTTKPTAAAPAPISAAVKLKDVKLKVMAKGSGVPVSRAEVSVAGSKHFTDPEGVVSVDIPPGDGNVEIYRATYKVKKIKFADLRRQTDVFEVYLLPATPDDNEVLIRGEKRPEASRKTVSIKEAAKVAPGGDPAQVPKLLPGVQSRPFQPTVVVRGSGPEDSRYYIDDFEVPFIFHRIGNISVIPDQLLSDVEFSSGGFGAQYGGATGGVITLRTKTDIPERPKTEVRMNIPIFSSIYHERPIGKDAMLAVSARRSYLDAFLPYVIPKDSDMTVVPYFGDMHAYYYKTTDDGHFSVLYMNSYDGLKLAFPSSQAEDQNGRGQFNLRSSFNTAGFEWQKNLGDGWSVTTTPQATDYRDRFDFVGNRVHLTVDSAAITTELSKRLSKTEHWYIGGQVQYGLGEADVLAPRPDFNDPFFDPEEAPKQQIDLKQSYTAAALWTSIDRQLGPVIVTPGLRGFYTDQIHKGSADPRLNARWKLTDTHALKAAVGQFSETPQFRDTTAKFGNPHLNFIRSYHYVLGIESDWGSFWKTDFQVFHKHTYDMVKSAPVTNTNNAGDMLSSGFEAFIRRNLTERFFGWLSYTYSVNKERDTDQETYRNSQYDQTHVVNLAGDYKFTGVWDLGGRFAYHTGDTYTGVNDAVYNANLDKYQPRTAPDARLYNKRLPSYHEADIYSSYDFLYDTWKLTLRTGVEFLAIRRQPIGVQYNYDYSKTEYFQGVPPIPYVELRGVL